MANNKENQRVRLTKKLLKNALVELLMDTPLQKVSITEICSRAEINRTTFYKYYSSECDLYADIENDFLNILSQNLKESGTVGLENLLAVIEANPKVAAALINNSSEEEFSGRIFSLPEVTGSMNFKKLEKTGHHYDILFYICSGSYAIIKRWVNNGFDRSPKEMSDFLQMMIAKVIK